MVINRICKRIIPPFFNLSYLWLLPKCDPPGGVFSPEDTRPLSGANTDSKIFAGALSFIFAGLAEVWAVFTQRGFIAGRSMLQNVVDLETQSLVFSYERQQQAAMILFDFSAAFPSVARAFVQGASVCPPSPSDLPPYAVCHHRTRSGAPPTGWKSAHA